MKKVDEQKHSAEKFLKLEEELMTYKKIMSDASDIIRDQNVSEFPIFVAHQQQMEIGLLIAERGKVKGNWNIHATTLEEMTYKQIIKEENVEEFKNVFQNPADHICIFVLSELGAQFIFLQR